MNVVIFVRTWLVVFCMASSSFLLLFIPSTLLHYWHKRTGGKRVSVLMKISAAILPAIHANDNAIAIQVTGAEATAGAAAVMGAPGCAFSGLYISGIN